jgi:hypothetical protein
MDAVVKEKWVAALKSDKYKQGKHRLRSVNDVTGDRLCCLGVLCEVAIESGLDLKFDRDGVESGYLEGDNKFPHMFLLPPSVAEWAGFDGVYWVNPTLNSVLDEEGEPTFLSNLNDIGKPFTDIADLIEKEL